MMLKLLQARGPLRSAAKLKSILSILLCAGIAQAQAESTSQKKPWQGTFTRTAQSVHSNVPFVVDIPVPAGKILTVEQIGVIAGPFANVYGKVMHCAIEATYANEGNQNNAAAVARIQLPALTLVENAGRTWSLYAPLRLHAGPGTTSVAQKFSPLRVSCVVDAMIPGDQLSVTAVGYATPQ
jgi:hypothetical protein